MPITGADRADPPAQLPTQRLRLRFHGPGDLDRLVDLIGEFEVARWLARVPYPYGRADGESFIAATSNGITEEGELIYAIAQSVDDRIIGAAGLIMDGDEAELGYWLGQPYWGQGLAIEAVTALLGLAFGDLGLDRVYANVRVENARSRRLLETLGFAEQGVASIYQMIERRHVLGPHYELTAQAWKDWQS